MRLSLNIRTIGLAVTAFVVAVFLTVVAARTEAIVIVDTGDDGKPLAFATLALLDANGITPVTTGKGDNYAFALNAKDGTTLVETAFLITYAASGIVDQNNAAVAYASCDSCQAFAAAIEVVLVPTDNVKDVTPTNLAAAVNEECTTCETIALSTQIVLGVDGPVGFTEEGNEEIEQIQEELRQLEEGDTLTAEEFQARYDELVARLRDVLANELVPVGNSDQHKQEEREGTTFEETTSGSETTSGPETTTETTLGPETTEGTQPEPTTPQKTTPQKTDSEQTVPEMTGPEVTGPETSVLEETAPVETVPESTAPTGATVPAGGSTSSAAPETTASTAEPTATVAPAGGSTVPDTGAPSTTGAATTPPAQSSGTAPSGETTTAP